MSLLTSDKRTNFIIREQVAGICLLRKITGKVHKNKEVMKNQKTRLYFLALREFFLAEYKKIDVIQEMRSFATLFNTP